MTVNLPKDSDPGYARRIAQVVVKKLGRSLLRLAGILIRALTAMPLSANRQSALHGLSLA